MTGGARRRRSGATRRAGSDGWSRTACGHWASRAGGAPQPPTGPDDDPEFISALERLIRGEDPGGLA